jgi:hypothetical protein
MKRLAIILALSFAVLARQPLSAAGSPSAVWFHSGLVVGSANRETPVQEVVWGELDLNNTHKHPVTVTVTVRRWTGALVLEEACTVPGHAKRTVRIEDSAINLANVDTAAPIPDELRATVLVAPAPLGLEVAMRNLQLNGNILRTSVVNPHREEMQLRTTAASMTLMHKMTHYTLSNLTDSPAVVSITPTRAADLKRDPWGRLADLINSGGAIPGTEEDMRLEEPPPATFTLPPYATISVPVTVVYTHHCSITKPRGVIVGRYGRADGSDNSFNVDSSITFGSTVPEKK